LEDSKVWRQSAQIGWQQIAPWQQPPIESALGDSTVAANSGEHSSQLQMTHIQAAFDCSYALCDGCGYFSRRPGFGAIRSAHPVRARTKMLR